MFAYDVDGIQVESNEELADNEAAAYAQYCLEKYGKQLERVSLQFDGSEVDVNCYSTANRGFERIRRITGYLVGTLDRFNDAKTAEVHDRVKHTI